VPDEAHVVQALLQRGWAVSPGAPYRLQSERAIRVTISALQEDEADDLASAIANSLRPVSARGRLDGTFQPNVGVGSAHCLLPLN
jgi:DNA-binding transcriptional MocR family regulator